METYLVQENVAFFESFPTVYNMRAVQVESGTFRDNK